MSFDQNAVVELTPDAHTYGTRVEYDEHGLGTLYS